MEYHKVYDKVKVLQAASDSGKWSAEETGNYQKLDCIITDSMLHAKRNTGRLVSTRYEWSPALKQSVQAFRYWQLRYRQVRNLGISLPRLITLQSQAGLSDEEVNVTSVCVILQQLQLAANTLCQHQK